MTDRSTGEIRDDVLNERVLSAIVESKVNMDRVPEVLRIVEEAASRIDTIVSIGVATRCDREGGNTLEDLLSSNGYAFWRGKTNLGLGRAGSP